MAAVYVYGGQGKYSGDSELLWESPQPGNVHNFMLFLLQEVSQPQDSVALDELRKFGFVEIKLQGGQPLKVEALDDPQMAAFQKYYEGAMAEGRAIVWYPNPIIE